MTPTQFKTFCEEFPSLWENFERTLGENFEQLFKKRYRELALTGSLDTIEPTIRTLEKLYHDVGRDYWGDCGAGSPWMKTLKEIFFDRKYYPLIEKFYSYDKLDSILAGRGVIFSCLFPTTEASWKLLFRLTLKPLLDDRKQELLDGLRQLEQELALPIPYSLSLPPDTDAKVFSGVSVQQQEG